MFEISVQTKETLKKLKNMTYDLAMQEKDALSKAASEVLTTKNISLDDHHAMCERLRYVLFQMSLAKVYKHTCMVVDLVDKSDEDIAEMCASAGETVQSALKNAMMNVVMDIITNLASD